jgi:catechol 2,3-dioxygenase-like lactoylglutathione lyase family enzyme
MHLQRIDHVVFTVQDIDATCAFYSRALGMEVVTFGAGRKALQFGQSRINLHQYGREFEPKAKNPVPGTQDICLVTDTSIPEVIQQLHSLGLEIIEGPAPRTGAIGAMESVYIRDPDGNLVEIAHYLEEIGES